MASKDFRTFIAELSAFGYNKSNANLDFTKDDLFDDAKSVMNFFQLQRLKKEKKIKKVASKGEVSVYHHPDKNSVYGLIEMDELTGNYPVFVIKYKTVKEGVQIEWAGSNPDFRGFAAQLLGYDYLIKHYNNVLSDAQLSIGSLASTWKQLAKNSRYEVTLYNKKTNETVDLDEIDFDLWSLDDWNSPEASKFNSEKFVFMASRK